MSRPQVKDKAQLYAVVSSFIHFYNAGINTRLAQNLQA